MHMHKIDILSPLFASKHNTDFVCVCDLVKEKLQNSIQYRMKGVGRFNRA